MASDFAKKAEEAFFDDDFGLAVDYYTKAIDLNPKSADLFADRAQAQTKLNSFIEAVADANKAIELDPTMAKAYLRKGAAFMKLGKYGSANAALEKVTTIQAKPSTSNLPPSTSSVLEPMSSVKPKYRHEYYQKPEQIVLTVFAKGIPAKHVAVDFGEQILSVTIDVPGEDAYHFQPRLFGKLNQLPGHPLNIGKEITIIQKANVPSVVSQRPTYPSSKSKTIDWDKLESQVKKEEKDEKLDGDAGLNKLFRDIYQNADEDMRRAMTKSFYESNGTVLSTDWKDVGSKKIEGSPPDGMEMKKW
ncbi:hypothetical protein Patl1_17634 [Pistacia atlantica]|uniref:Uncharacterized protein n=1 Tax=Pistacia atlantica TaxID=434234 RepID=A0ACC1C1F2_9ROSI|nr:hypothetical protein Patl1_17634 [Pistacia atlantica]